MGLIDKLKNVFFEEEDVPAQEEKVTVAKKIELPETKINYEPPEEPKAPVEKEEPKTSSCRFPMQFEEEDFQDTTEFTIKKEVVVQKVETIVEKKEEPIVYEPTPPPPPAPVETAYQGLYEGGIEKKKNNAFKPSPIISPIYGVLDRNYKKEEIVTKKEIILSTAPKKLDVDSVREKAYGDLASEISASINDEEEFDEVKIEEVDDFEEVEEENALYDLSEEPSPAVKNVTVGDAEEYFHELGLEYNVDYKDTSKEIAKETKKEEKPKATRSDRYAKKEIAEEVSNSEDDGTLLEDNLFDLIDSMYEEKE